MKTVGMLFASIVLGHALPSWAQNASNQVVGGLARCSIISDSLRRLECYDGLAKRQLSPKERQATLEEAGRAEQGRQSQLEIERVTRAETERVAREESERKRASMEADEQRQKIEASLRSAVLALRRLQSRVESGVSFTDYPAVLSEAKFGVSSVLSDSRSGPIAPAVADSLRTALTHYETAMEVWRVRFQSSVGRPLPSFFRFENPGLFDRIRVSYPDLPTTAGVTGPGFGYSTALPHIWSKATEQTDLAEAALAGPRR